MTKIEWAKNKDGSQGRTWNPVTGCSKISLGCQNCYAERMAKRLAGRCGYDADEPFKVTLHENRLEEPLHWRKPQMVFVCSMGDLFHEDVPFDFICDVYARMGFEQRHTFIVLTKRPERAREFFGRYENYRWPHPNVWLGVTAENQEMADERIPILLQIPAAVRFVSVEPMLGSIDLTNVQFDKWTRMNVLEGCGITTRPGGMGQMLPNAFCEKLSWIIAGGETGPKARPMHPDWARSLRDQCQEAGVPFFFKQWGRWAPAGNYCRDEDGLWMHTNGDTFGPLEGETFSPTPTAQHMIMVGKKAAGRLLDGRTWDEMPGVNSNG